MTRILIVDDHPLIRSGLRELIQQERDLSVCAETTGARAALELAQEEKPDLAIIDITLNDGDGIDLLKQLRARHPALKMLVCSMHDERIYASQALRAGAVGYVSKNEPAERIIDAIRKVLGGGLYLSPRISDHLLHVMASSAQERSGRLATELLSDRELGVLRLIGDGLTSRQIAKQLGLSVKTVDTHREHIKAKLDLQNANELIRYAVTWNLRASAES